MMNMMRKKKMENIQKNLKKLRNLMMVNKKKTKLSLGLLISDYVYVEVLLLKKRSF